MLVRVRPGAPLSVKTGHSPGSDSIVQNGMLGRGLGPEDADFSCGHFDPVNEQSHIGFAQNRIISL